ncbi:MAG: hypothetical protein MJZ37_08155 [Bacilli bacterium]|nr:hypothetical protein [Bacilli bacterium]
MAKKLLSFFLAAVLYFGTYMDVYALEPVLGDPFMERVKIRCTCYLDTGITASGVYTRQGIIAGKKEWMGCVAILWTIDGEYIGIYEVLDTGAGIDTDHDGKGDSIKTGNSIDVWMPDMESAKEWVKKYGDYVYFMLYKAEG